MPCLLCLLVCAVASHGALPGLRAGPAADGSYLSVTPTEDRPLYFAESGVSAVALPDTSATEGTLCFAFTPDWSPGDCTTHWLLELKGQGLLVAFRKGYDNAISPEYCYVFTDPDGGMVGFHPENLFRARQRRHYAIRWSAARNRLQLVVDGEASGRVGKFKCEGPPRLPATLTLYGMAGGTFDHLRLYGRYLTVPEIVQVAGLKQPARYLQEQRPPTPAAGGADTSSSEDDQPELLPPYNPADYPDLPVTPHTKWARPLAGGKLRILFAATHGFFDEYSMIREAAELWQRLDCDLLVTNRPDPRVMSRDFDVIAVSLQGFTNGRWAGWSDLDPKLRAWILDRAKSGKSGLVWAYPTAPDDAINGLCDPQKKRPNAELLRGFPDAALAQPNSKDGAFRWDKVYELDEGYFLKPGDIEGLVEVSSSGGAQAPAPRRAVVKLNYHNASWHPVMGLTPDTALNAAATDAQYDEWMALAARAMLVAAGREPACRITAVQVSGEVRTVTLAPAANLAGLRLSVRARDLWGRPYGTPSVVAAAPIVAVKGPALPPRTLVDCLLRDAEGRVVDWFAASTPPAADPRIAALQLDREAYVKGQAVNGAVSVEGARAGECKVQVYLTDHEGRRLRQGACDPIRGGRAAFRVAIPASSDSLLMRVEALLSLGGRPADLRGADVPVPEVTPRGFYPLLYGSPFNRLCERTRHRLFRDRFGVRGGFHQGAHSWANLAALNLTSIEYSGHLGYPSQPSDCEAFAENWDKNVTAWLMGPPEKMIPYRPLFYSLGEEHYVLMSSCPTPTANARFREWLRGKYGALEHLNHVWGSKYAAWDEVTMIDPEIVDMTTIRFDVVRFENRRFMERLFADRHAFLANYLRRADPQGRTGIHAGWDLWMGRGYDYWLLSRAMEDMMCYGGPHNHYARSFFQRYYGSHYHYNIGSHENARWHPWYMVLSGARGLSWYTDAPQIWGATTADLHLTSDWTAASEEFRAAAEAGDLLARTTYRDDQVAIHYSQDSFQAGVRDLTWIHQRFINLCFDSGLPFRFVSYEQVEQGDLLKRRPELLILPHSIALSPAEARAIRDYLAAGGIVWADILPGTHDNLGRKLEQSQLADLFEGLQETTLSSGGHVATRRVGPGTVVLADPGNYSYDRNVGRTRPAEELLAAIPNGPQPVARALDAQRHLANGVWTAGWTNGAGCHVAVAKDYQLADRTPAAVTLALPQPGHVYEMRSGRYFGKLAAVPATLQPTRGQVFTVLPYRIRGLKLTLAHQPPARGQDLVLDAALQVEGTVGPQDLNVLQVSVADPTGREVTALRRTVEMRGGKGRIALPVAYGDPSGKWTVTVRDLATRLTQTVAYSL